MSSSKKMNHRFRLNKLLILLSPIFITPAYALDWGDHTGSAAFNTGDTASSIETGIGDVITVTGAGGIVIDNSASPNDVPVYIGAQSNVNLGNGTIINNIHGTSPLPSTNNAGLVVNSSNGLSTLNAENLRVNVEIAPSGPYAYGIRLYDEVDATFTGTTNINVQTHNNANTLSNGFAAGMGANARIENINIQINSAGTAQGLLSQWGANVVIDGNTTITSSTTKSSGNAYGLVTHGGAASYHSYLEMGHTTVLNVLATQDSQVLVGATATWGTTVYNGDLIINADHQGYDHGATVGLVALRDAEQRVNGRFIMTSLGGGNVDPDSTYVHAQYGGSVYLNGESFVGAAANPVEETAFIAYANSLIESNNQKMTVYGKVIADGGSIDLSVTNGSYFRSVFDTLNNGTNNLSMDGGSAWEMTGTSTLSSLNFDDNASQVRFLSDPSAGAYYVLNTENLSGNGHYAMNVDIAGNAGDQINVTGTTAGAHTLAIANNGSAATDGSETRTVVLTADGQGTFSSNDVSLGGYVYELKQVGNDWVLMAKIDNNNNSGGSHGGIVISPEANAAASFINTGYFLNYADLQTLYQRMGELRSHAGQDGNVWGRSFAGKLDSSSSGSLRGFDMDYYGVQFGADRHFEREQGDLYTGIAAGYTQGKPSYGHEGSGTVKGYSLSLYATYKDDSDFYIDTVAKYMRLQNRFSVNDSLQQEVTGSANSNGFGLSVEVGKRYAVSNGPYYVEPQGQLSYSHQGSSTANASSGLKVHLESYDSVIGRLGVLLGYQSQESENPLNAYIKLGYLTELGDGVHYFLNGSQEEHKLSGNWFEAGVGFSANIAERHNLYGELNYSDGKGFNRAQVNIGYRYQF